MHESVKEPILYRKLLAIIGTIYLLWWFIVESILPEAYNPFISRFIVVLVGLAFLISSYVSPWCYRRLKYFFMCCMWLITAHYYYLFYNNVHDMNWIVGAYITVMAIGLAFLSRPSLLFYSAFVMALSVGLCILVPELKGSVFLPGLITILLQANIGLQSRLKLIHNLDASNRSFQLLFNSTFEGVLVHEAGRIVNVNEGLGRMFGYSPGELIGREVILLVSPSDRAGAVERMGRDEAVVYEVRGLRKDGTEFDLEVRGKTFEFENRPTRLVTMLDIGDRKKAEKERVRALTMEENVRIRDEFISIASHELKTPLSSLKLQGQMIDRQIKHGRLKIDPPGALQAAMGIFNRQVEHMIAMVEKMLDVSRISSGQLEIEKREMDWSALAREISLEFPIQLEAESPLIVLGDRMRLKQVLENLLTNAFKYGGGNPIVVRLSRNEREAILEVEDHGMGIAPENVGRIFDRFERAISAQKVSGLGLGLYITKEIVRAHGGTISVQSQVGEGSKFAVHLPVSRETTH